MQLKNSEVLDIAAALSIITPQPGIFVPAALKLRRLRKELIKEQETIDEMRIDLLKLHCTKDEEGTPVMKTVEGQQSYDIPEDALEVFNKEFQQLLEETVEVNIEPFSASRLDNVQVSVNMLDRLIDIGILLDDGS